MADFESHDWVENYREFEAVFCCTNEILTNFDVEQTIRCFQTFNWFEVAVPTGDLTFNHSEYGVSIVFDGAVVAVNTADFQNAATSDKLRMGCRDLFCALTELGWVNAVVYHPFETSMLFMADMGKAIPAHAKFNLELADSIKNTNNLPEAAAMMAKHVNAMPNLNDVSHLVEAVSALGSAPVARGKTSGNDLASMRLSDDDPVVSAPPKAQVPASEVAASPRPGTRQFIDDSPPIASLQMSSSAVSLSESASVPPAPMGFALSSLPVSTDPDLLLEIKRLQEALAMAQSAQLEARETLSRHAVVERSNQALALKLGEVERQLLEEKQSSLAKEVDAKMRVDGLNVKCMEADQALAKLQSQHTHLLGELEALRTARDHMAPAANDLLEHASLSAVALTRVGGSAFCFDKPGFPITDLQLHAVGVASEFKQVVHLHPGLVDQPVRWDFFSEIDTSQPWLLQTLVGHLGIQDVDNFGLRQVMVRLFESKRFPQLRDVIGEGFDSQFQSFGNLGFCDPGRAFVDIRSSEDEVLAANMVSMLSLRAVAKSPDKVLYVVHVDALDGPFVHWLADVVGALAKTYASSKRVASELATQVIDPEELVSEEPSTNAQLASEIQVVVGPLLEKLKALGVSI